MADLTKMLAQVKQMQEQFQQDLQKLTLEASAGGGMVTVRMNGKKELVEVRIEPDVIRESDREMLQDLVRAAVNEAVRQVDEQVQQKMLSLAGGLNLPRIPGLF